MEFRDISFFIDRVIELSPEISLNNNHVKNINPYFSIYYDKGIDINFLYNGEPCLLQIFQATTYYTIEFNGERLNDTLFPSAMFEDMFNTLYKMALTETKNKSQIKVNKTKTILHNIMDNMGCQE